MHFTERRRHQRCGNLICKVCVSTDRRRWSEVELCNISAGGLKFRTRSIYPEDACLFFNLQIYNMLSEFIISAEGRILRTEKDGSGFAYAVKFQGLDKYHQVQLDELIKLRLTVDSSAQQHVLEDETYTFMLVPDMKPPRKRIRIAEYK